MNLPLFIAFRYLFAKKSHNVINIISAISAIGMAIGTAALIIILSVYNGFDSIVKTMLGNVEPELLITPAEGKTFVPEGEVYDWLYAQQSVTSICTVLQENVFINYEGKQSIAKAKGVDSIYEEESPLKDYLRRGEFSLHHGDLPLAVTGAGLAHRLGIDPRFVAPIEMYFPSRTRNISLLNPAASIESVKVFPSGIFSVNNDIDNSLVILPIETMRELLGYDGNEVSAVEIRMTGASAKEIRKVQETAEKMLGSGFRVSDRFGQNPALYKMMKYEKASIYLILMFIIIIIAFNIFGSLSMLIMEKKDVLTGNYAELKSYMYLMVRSRCLNEIRLDTARKENLKRLYSADMEFLSDDNVSRKMVECDFRKVMDMANMKVPKRAFDIYVSSKIGGKQDKK